MKVKTLEKRFEHSPYDLRYVSTNVNCGVKIYTIRADGLEFTTGIVQEATREGNGILRVQLFPFITFEHMRFLTGYKRSGRQCTQSMQLILEDNPYLGSRYNNITTSYETHKKRTDEIAQHGLETMSSLPKRKERCHKDYMDYLELAKKI